MYSKVKLARNALISGALSLLVMAVSCGGGGAVDPSNRVALDSVAVTPLTLELMVGATQPLAVMAFANGQVLTGHTVTFAAQNADVADVDALGTVRGVAAGAAVIVVTATRDGTSRSVNVAVNVTATSPGSPPEGVNSATVTTSGSDFVPPAVTITPGGSVTWQITGATHNVTFGANKPTGGDIPNTASGGSATRVFPTEGSYPYQCTLHSIMTGTVLVQTAAGWGGGGTQNPDAVVSATADAFNPERVEIAVGGTVVWVFSGGTNNVTFEDLQPPGGNIPDSAPGTSVARTFSVAGDYDYVSTRNSDMRGRVRVR